MARILLIDDDDAFRTMLSKTLTHFGHIVIEARNGKEGMELFPYSYAELLITDIVMPEKEGIEVLMELWHQFPPLKTIAISGGGLGKAEIYLRAAELLGAARVLKKPFTKEELMVVVNEVLAIGKWRPRDLKVD